MISSGISILSLCFVALLFLAPAAMASGKACELRLQVNDLEAKISVDGHELSSAPPVILGCKESAQQIRVVSSDDQVFERAFPATSGEEPQKLSWNIVFNRTSGRARAIRASGSHVQVATADQTKIFAELAELRRLVNEIYVKRPDLHPARMPARAASASDRPGFLRGVYIQLHALAKGQANLSEVNAELAAKSAATLGGSSLILCHWKDQNIAKNWTRVLIGPFKKPSMAKNIAKLIGRDTFIIKDPNCSEN